jgi:hypothetical protein
MLIVRPREADVDVSQIKQRLKAKVPLEDVDRQFLRALIHSAPSPQADTAVDLLYAHPAETSVTLADRHLLELAFDRMHPTFSAALALSLLCNWLSLAAEQTERILSAIVSRTDDGDFLCIKACSCASMALAEIAEPRLAGALVEVFHDKTRLEGTRASARDALLRLDGLSSREIVEASRADPQSLWERSEGVAARLLS